MFICFLISRCSCRSRRLRHVKIDAGLGKTQASVNLKSDFRSVATYLFFKVRRPPGATSVFILAKRSFAWRVCVRLNHLKSAYVICNGAKRLICNLILDERPRLLMFFFFNEAKRSGSGLGKTQSSGICKSVH